MDNMQQFYQWLILHLDYILPMKRIDEDGWFYCPVKQDGSKVWVYEQRASGIRVLAYHCYSTHRVPVEEDGDEPYV